MSEDYREKLLKQFEQSQTTSEGVEKIIDLLHDSLTLDADTQAKAIAFLEGYRAGLKEQIEWLNCIIP